MNLKENSMDKHVKVAGWLWIANGVLAIPILIIGLVIINSNVPGRQDAMLVTGGALCFFLPGMAASAVVAYGLLKYKAWARILAIVLAILNLILFPIGTLIGIYTLWVMFNDETKALLGAES
jgi:hypothetical protein